VLRRHGDLLDVPDERVGPVDRLSVNEVVELFDSLPDWSTVGRRARGRRIAGAGKVLAWLLTHPGTGWQARWRASGADEGTDWVDALVAEDARAEGTKRGELISGLACLLLCRVVLPSYRFLASYNAHNLFGQVRRAFRPDLFAKIEEEAAALGVRGFRRNTGLTVISKMVLHTGRDLDQLTADDLFAYRTWTLREHGRGGRGTDLAWVLLRGVTDLGEHASLRDALRFGQRPTTELVDTYRLRCRPIRDLLIRYLDERRPALDYASFRTLVINLVGNFWADIEHHHPGIDTLQLPDEVAQAWKQRLRVLTGGDGSTRPRRNYYDVVIVVRSFYLDIQEWALDDPSWAAWAVPSPVRKGESGGLAKARKRVTAEMHQRIRDRLPHLPALAETAERHRVDQAGLLAAATATPVGQTLEHGGRRFLRTVPRSYVSGTNKGQAPLTVQVEELVSGKRIDLTRGEDEAFWAWAIIETLRLTGVRVEELLEITHLALVSYRLPDTGEIVPMLQIVPSKSNEERLLLVSPELASVLATIITRLRDRNGGAVPLTARYDPHEKVTGPPLPHLFQRRVAWRWEVPSHKTIQKLLTHTLAGAGLCDAAGQPLRYTPHDFRRMFATEAVTGGLPVHIVARLLGHKNLSTSHAYMAVFDDELVRTYRAFLDKRRAVRPDAEYREPTEEEWREFQQHFQVRKLELGECGRPYRSPCRHEHACIRCPSLRLDPAARHRLVEIIANLKDRIQEARMNGWLGEVQGLQGSLDAATRKLVSLDRIRNRQPTGPVNLGIPVIATPQAAESATAVEGSPS
jgi:integrase